MDKPLGFYFFAISRGIRNHIKNKAIDYGVNSTCLDILRILTKNINGLKQNEICEILQLKAPTVSLTLNDMTNNKLIIKKKSKEDNRATIVCLTDKGLALSEKMKSIHIDTDNQIKNLFDEADFDKLSNMLEEILNKVGELDNEKNA